jgi:hypothetical protein
MPKNLYGGLLLLTGWLPVRVQINAQAVSLRSFLPAVIVAFALRKWLGKDAIKKATQIDDNCPAKANEAYSGSNSNLAEVV